MKELMKEMERLRAGVDPELHTSLDCVLSTFQRLAGIPIAFEYIAYISPLDTRPGIIRRAATPALAVDAALEEYNAYAKLTKENS